MSQTFPPLNHSERSLLALRRRGLSPLPPKLGHRLVGLAAGAKVDVVCLVRGVARYELHGEDVGRLRPLVRNVRQH